MFIINFMREIVRNITKTIMINIKNIKMKIIISIS